MTYEIYSTTGQWLYSEAEGRNHIDAVERKLQEQPVAAIRNGGRVIVVQNGGYGHQSAKLITVEKIEQPTYKVRQA